jgi:hypothetical protein
LTTYSQPLARKAGFDLSNVLFLASLICVCLTEAFMIRGLWFRVSPPTHTLRGFDLPFLVWIPALGALSLKQGIRKLFKKGEVGSALAVTLTSGLSILLLTTYLLITRLAQIAYR